jgi:PIN domain nuclease of toxin-antitoxin system
VLLLLDTHVWIWSVEGDTRRVGRRTRQLLAKAEADDAIRVSPLSVFEVAALHTAGRLRLGVPRERWIDHALAAGGVRLAPFSAGIATDAGAITRDALADPIDRLLVASARQLDATLLTSDRRILDYATKTRNVRAQDAGA